MANASLTKVNEQYWAAVQGKVKDWIQKTDATVLVLYIPQPTKRNPIPTLKFEGSRKLKAVVESEEVRSAISKACSGPPPPMRSIKDEMEFPLLKCDACGATQDTAAVSQCCMDHLICKACVEKQAKKVISPESKETQIPCPMFGCTTYIPKSQASKVLPSLIMELLEEKINKRAMESITKMQDLHCCPFCDFPVCMEYDRKEFFCPNTECMKLSCRYCKKDLANDRSISHDNCTYFMTLLEESNDHLELPKYWHPMPSEQKDFILVNLYQSGREFKMIKNLFCHSMKSVNPITIYRIQNPRLWQTFGLTRKHMAEEFGENLVNEQQLFHGTQTDAIGTICRDGLDWRMCGENGVAFGQGTYFAKDALYSNRYSLPHRNPERWSRAVHLPANNALSGGITYTLQCSVGSSGIPNNFKISSSPSMSLPQDPNQVNALQGIGAHAGGFGTVTYGTPFGITPQEPQTSNYSTPKGAPENSSSPGTSVTQNVTSKPLGVTSDVTQIMREGLRYMFVARVLVGRSGQGSHGMRKPQQDIKDPKRRAFNSCVDFVDKPSIFVIFDNSQCYPEYLIEYSHPKVPKSRR